MMMMMMMVMMMMMMMMMMMTIMMMMMMMMMMMKMQRFPRRGEDGLQSSVDGRGVGCGQCGLVGCGWVWMGCGWVWGVGRGVIHNILIRICLAACFSHFPQARESAVFPPRLRREPVKTPGPGLAVQQFQFQFQFLWLQILMCGLWICGSSC